jgi:signal transduction histidine kinase
MMLKRRQVLRMYQWAVVTCAFLGLLVLAQASAVAAHQTPDLGLRAAISGDQMSVSWVQPAGIAWDAGIRPGDIVTMIDGKQVDRHTPLSALASAKSVQVQSDARGRIDMYAPRALDPHQASIDRRVAFLTLAACFIMVGAVIFVLSVELATGRVVLSLSFAAATAFIAAIATPSRVTWALMVEHVAVTIFCASVFLLFLVFPINRLLVLWGRVAAAICLGVTLTLLGLYAWMLTINPTVFSWLEPGAYAVLAADFVGAAVLAILALAQRSTKQQQVRPALALIVLGILAGLAPFFLLTIVPRMFGLSSWPHVPVEPETAILTSVLVPIGLGAAVLSRQFPGITRLIRRSLVALAVWTMLVTVYTIGLYVLYQALDATSHPLEPEVPLTALVVAFIGATFAPGQSWLRRTIERIVFHDVYNYAETLERLSNEIARLSTIDAIAWHVLYSLAKMLDLSWAAITISSPGATRMIYRWGDCPESLSLLIDGDMSPPQWGATHSHPTKSVEEQDTLLVPLVAEEASLGLLAVGPKRGDLEHLPEDKALIATLTPLVTTALHNALLTQSLEQQVATLAERECALAALTERLLQAHEEERHRIALDLHDDPLQRAILLTREMTEISGETLPSHVRRSAEEIAISLRAICTGLRPPVLDDLGLVASLEWLASDISARSDLTASLMVDGFGPVECTRLETNLEVALYRVAQEALTNCVKHARASHVWVTLQREAHLVRLRVIDDGQGWNSIAEDTDQGHHLGLLGMRERLRPWGGAVQIGANPTGGTLVSADVRLRGDDDCSS